jgi:Protein phosphatase 1 inhibitor
MQKVKLSKAIGTTFEPLYRDKKHKFKNGHWMWSSGGGDGVEEKDVQLKFHSHDGRRKNGKMNEKRKRIAGDEMNGVGLIFVNDIDEPQEELFRRKFQRENSFCDSDVITIQDIKIIALYTLQTRVSNDFIEFLHTALFDKFLHACIFYIDLYLRVVELLLIRRDETNEDGKIRDIYTLKVERFLSKELSDRRLLIAREYSKVVSKTFLFSELLM